VLLACVTSVLLASVARERAYRAMLLKSAESVLLASVASVLLASVASALLASVESVLLIGGGGGVDVISEGSERVVD